MKYVIWGCGLHGKNLLQAFGKESVSAFIDSNVEKQGRYYDGVPIVSYDNYIQKYRECIIILSPARNAEDVVIQLQKDRIEFLGIDSIPTEILIAYQENIFDYLEESVCSKESIFLYGFTTYNVLLYEHFMKLGKKVYILQRNEKETVPEQFRGVVHMYEKGRFDAICVSHFMDCDELIEENIIPLYLLEKMPFIKYPMEALQIPENFLHQPNRKQKIIVSLTTHEKRLDSVSYAIGTMMRQTVKPDKIILYMADECKCKIPEVLNKQIEHGVEIRFVEDLKPHKKYYYVMQEYPEDIIITIDDDIFYRLDTIEKLYESYQNFPNCVSTMIADRVTVDSNGNINSCKEWIRYGEGYGEKGCPSMYLSAIGAGGILYPPHCMGKEVFNKEVFMELCPLADDLWLKIMQFLFETPVVLAIEKRRSGIEVDAVQKYGLRNYNITENGNDIQLKNLLNKYIKWNVLKDKMKKEVHK